MSAVSAGARRDVVAEFLDAVSAVERGVRDPSLTAEAFEALVAEREVLRREIGNRLRGAGR